MLMRFIPVLGAARAQRRQVAVVRDGRRVVQRRRGAVGAGIVDGEAGWSVRMARREVLQELGALWDFLRGQSAEMRGEGEVGDVVDLGNFEDRGGFSARLTWGWYNDGEAVIQEQAWNGSDTCIRNETN